MHVIVIKIVGRVGIALEIRRDITVESRSQELFQMYT